MLLRSYQVWSLGVWYNVSVYWKLIPGNGNGLNRGSWESWQEGGHLGVPLGSVWTCGIRAKRKKWHSLYTATKLEVWLGDGTGGGGGRMKTTYLIPCLEWPACSHVVLVGIDSWDKGVVEEGWCPGKDVKVVLICMSLIAGDDELFLEVISWLFSSFKNPLPGCRHIFWIYLFLLYFWVLYRLNINFVMYTWQRYSSISVRCVLHFHQERLFLQ